MFLAKSLIVWALYVSSGAHAYSTTTTNIAAFRSPLQSTSSTRIQSSRIANVSNTCSFMKRNSIFQSLTTATSCTRLFAAENTDDIPDDEKTQGSDSDNNKTEEKAPESASSTGSDVNANVNDILNSPAFLKRKVDVLKSDIEAVKEKIEAANKIYEANKAEWGPDFDKLKLEYANISERLENQSKAGRATSIKEVAKKLLTVMDNYDRAFQQVTPETEQEKEIESSYKHVYTMIVNALGELGVKEIETVGKEFDYEMHQAVIMRPDENYDEGIVCDELAKGWAMEEGELIRPAMVVVSQ